MQRENRDWSKEMSTHIRPVPQYVLDRGNYQSDLNGMGTEAIPSGTSLRDYLQLAIKYRWLIASTTCLVVFAALLYSFLATPLYTATGTVQVGTYSPVLPGMTVEGAMSQQTQTQDYLNTQVQILSNYRLADRVLSQDDLSNELRTYNEKYDSTGIFESLRSLFSGGEGEGSEKRDASYLNPVPRLRSYIDMISISPVRATSLIKVSATTADPELSAKITNAHMQSFIDLSRTERQKTTIDNLVFLQSQSEELSGKVAVAERNMAKYAEENAIVSLNKDENIVVKRMGELNALLTAATAKRIQSETKFQEAKVGPGYESSAFDDPSMIQTRIALKEAEAEYALLGEKFTPEYPRMIQLKARIDALKQNLKQQYEQSVKGLESLYLADKKAEDELQQELEIQKSKAFELSRRQVQYNIMKREYDSLVDLQQAVLRQLKEAQISSQSSSTNISVADPAAVPSFRSSPNRKMNLLFAILLGPVLGCVLALVSEALDNTFKTPEEAQRVLKVPTLGVVPMFGLTLGETRLELPESPLGSPKNDGDLPSVHLGNMEVSTITPNGTRADDIVALSSPKSIASEAYRTIRTAILLSSADHPPRKILVTSGQKSEGKTTLITNLAVTLAQSGNKTLLIDADLRRPAVHKFFGIDLTQAGLVDYLTGHKDPGSIILSTSIENLSFIPAGAIPPNPSELVGSRRMAEFLDLLAQQFDYILIDAPPILPVTDAVLLSRVVDGVALVVRSQETHQHIAREATAKLRQVGARILGIVLNDVDLRSGDYYYYRRGYYAYYREEEGPKKRRRAVG